MRQNDFLELHPFYTAYVKDGLLNYNFTGLTVPDTLFLDATLDGISKPGMKMYELGSFLGMSTCMLGRFAKQMKTRLTAIDLFCGTSGAEQKCFENGNYDVKAHLEWNLNRVGVRDAVDIVKSDSAAYASNVPDKSVDFLFIDADHTYKGIRADIDAWLPKMKNGSTISGHDYDSDTFDQKYIHEDEKDDIHHGVIKAVNETFKDVKCFPTSSVWVAEV